MSPIYSSLWAPAQFDHSWYKSGLKPGILFPFIELDWIAAYAKKQELSEKTQKIKVEFSPVVLHM